MTIEPKFKERGNYLGRCHQWVGEPAPPGHLPGWSAASECWYVVLMMPQIVQIGQYIGKRWIIAGFDREAVAAAAQAVADLHPGYVEIKP